VKKCSTVFLFLLIATLSLAQPFAPKDKDKGPTVRLLTGKVLDRQDNPLSGAVVYLSDSRTQGVKTYITGPDGVFRFPALSLNIDYGLYAQCRGRRSDTKTVSQFDSRPQVNIDLKIDMK
jgi:hypothetical protein